MAANCKVLRSCLTWRIKLRQILRKLVLKAMSWDISIYSAKEPPSKVSELPDDWAPDPLGPTDEVRSRFLDGAPDIDWSDPTWGVLDRGAFSIEIDIGSDEICQTGVLHVRGGEDVVPVVESLSVDLGWYALDLTNEEWFHHSDDTGEGLRKFNDYRDRAHQKPTKLGLMGTLLGLFKSGLAKD